MVFLGTVMDIIPDLPFDFASTDSPELSNRQDSSEPKGDKSSGRTIRFRIEKQWKPSGKKDYTMLVEPDPHNTCEWQYDLQTGDRYIVFASRYGNYPAFPPQMFDGRSAYTLRDPSSRVTSQYQLEHYAESIDGAKLRFRQLLTELGSAP